MYLTPHIRQKLRITTDAYDEEIYDLIVSAIRDLKMAGIFFDEDQAPIDPLIKQAITTYAKANFGYDNPEADRFRDSYVMLKQHLALCGEYHGPME